MSGVPELSQVLSAGLSKISDQQCAVGSRWCHSSAQVEAIFQRMVSHARTRDHHQLGLKT
ncbi:hypothetical protein PRBEI_2001438200 [Prionailurus iriomotensis]